MYVEILSMFICQFLSSVRMAEHSVSNTVINKFVMGMEELKGVLSKFGSSLVSMQHVNYSHLTYLLLTILIF